MAAKTGSADTKPKKVTKAVKAILLISMAAFSVCTPAFLAMAALDIDYRTGPFLVGFVSVWVFSKINLRYAMPAPNVGRRTFVRISYVVHGAAMLAALYPAAIVVGLVAPSIGLVIVATAFAAAGLGAGSGLYASQLWGK